MVDESKEPLGRPDRAALECDQGTYAGPTDLEDGSQRSSGEINGPLASNELLQAMPNYIVRRRWRIGAEG